MSGNLDMRLCKYCGKTYPLTSEFWHKGKRSTGGFIRRCKACVKRDALANADKIAKRQAEYRIKNQDKLNEQAATYRAKNSEKIAEYKRRYQVEKKEEIARRKRGYYKSNREKISQMAFEYRLRNQSLLAERSKKYYLSNREKRLEYSRNWYQQNREHVLRITKIYYYANKHSLMKKRVEYQREYIKRNREIITSRRRKYREQNREKLNQQQRKYRAITRENQRLYAHRYRTLKRGLLFKFAIDDWICALNYFNGCCAYCGNPAGLFVFNRITADHFIPISDPDCPGTIPGNMVPACGSCNSSKNDKPPHDWVNQTFGKRKAAAILRRIAEFFEWVESVQEEDVA